MKECQDLPLDSFPEISAKVLKVLQETDPTLKALRGMVGKEKSEDGVIVKWREGLYRVGKEGEMQTREQLVLPTMCHRVVMELP